MKWGAEGKDDPRLPLKVESVAVYLDRLRRKAGGFTRSPDKLLHAGQLGWELRDPAGHHQTGRSGPPRSLAIDTSNGRHGCGGG